MNQATILLGSRSPRRRQLLSLLAAPEQIVVRPPLSSSEPGFEGLTTDAEISARLSEIVRMKHRDVLAQLNEGAEAIAKTSIYIVAADTIVIAGNPEGCRKVLGQPDPLRWEDDVRTWFRERLSGRSHDVWTGLMVSHGDSMIETIVRSQVTFGKVTDEMLEAYIATGESTGKAGGYGIQGHAAAFVTSVNGSLTNIIGLPVLEVADSLRTLGWKRAS
ncbi:MAG: Maf family protein [Planctomycetota bacterium]